MSEGDLDWLDDLPFDKPFEPGGDQLFFGLTENEDESGLPESMSAEKDFEPADDQFWFAHPLAEGADSLYRFRSGDTLTVALPDGSPTASRSAECGAPGGRSPSYCRQPLDRARIGCSRARRVPS